MEDQREQSMRGGGNEMQRTIPVEQARSEGGDEFTESHADAAGRARTRGRGWRKPLLLVGIALLLLIAAFIALILYAVSQLPPNFGG
jgi:hypothetical protein